MKPLFLFLSGRFIIIIIVGVGGRDESLSFMLSTFCAVSAAFSVVYNRVVTLQNMVGLSDPGVPEFHVS